MNRKLVAITGALMLSLGACTLARTASYNDSDNFRVMSRVVFVNDITDKYLLSIEGNEYFKVNPLDILFSSGMSKTVEEDWLVLV